VIPALSRLLIALVVLGAVSCTPAKWAVDAANDAGLDAVLTDGVAPLSCGSDDLMGRRITATNPRGQRIDAVVCCGIFKSCTVRYSR